MDREQLVSMLSAKSEGKRIKAVKLLKRAEEDEFSLIIDAIPKRRRRTVL